MYCVQIFRYGCYFYYLLIVTVCNVCSMNMQLLISLMVLVSGATCLPPHVVLLLADDLGWNDVSWHNQVQC